MKEVSPGGARRLLPAEEGGCPGRWKAGDLPRPHGAQGRPRERSRRLDPAFTGGLSNAPSQLRELRRGALCPDQGAG